METAIIIAAIALCVLCGVIAIAVVVTLPRVWRILGNMEAASASGAKVSADAASVSENIADHLDTTAVQAAAATAGVARAVDDFCAIAADFRAVSPSIAANLDTTSARVADTAGNAVKVTGDLAGVSENIADKMDRTANHAADTTDNLAKVTDDIASLSDNVATIGSGIAATASNVAGATYNILQTTENIRNLTTPQGLIVRTLKNLANNVTSFTVHDMLDRFRRRDE